MRHPLFKREGFSMDITFHVLHYDERRANPCTFPENVVNGLKEIMCPKDVGYILSREIACRPCNCLKEVLQRKAHIQLEFLHRNSRWSYKLYHWLPCDSEVISDVSIKRGLSELMCVVDVELLDNQVLFNELANTVEVEERFMLLAGHHVWD